MLFGVFLPFWVICFSGFAIEFEYGIRPLKMSLFLPKHFNLAVDVFDILAVHLFAKDRIRH